jgi:PAS domain S-box-containing protein
MFLHTLPDMKDEKKTRKKMFRHMTIYQSPVRLLIVIFISVFVSEASIMFLPSFLPSISTWKWAVLDATLLIFLLFPALYFFGFRPLILHITERKRAEAELEHLKRQDELILEAAGEGIFGIDLEGRVIFVNPSAARMLGYEVGELIGEIHHDKVHYLKPDRTPYPSEECPVYAAYKDGSVHYGEDEVFWRKDGTSIPIDYVSTPIIEKGKLKGAVVTFSDISDRRKLEEQLLQAQKMEAIGQLAGGIAHDFNNILTAIIGFGNLLQMEISKNSPLNTYLTRILSSAQRAANLTQGLLAFSRRQIISPKPVNLNEVIKVLENLLPRLIGEDIELSILLKDKDLIIMADSTQIEQVLMNLATNARDAMLQGGSLTIRTDIAEFDSDFIKAQGFGRPGSYALISVEDTGEGIDEKTKEKIFEPFFTTKEVGKGTGLGLSMVYGIIKQHDGYINVYSEPGRGTTFKIYLPLIKSKVEEIKPSDLSVLKGGAETILVAEDDTLVRELTKEVLTWFGYKVLEAIDGEDAIRVFNENKDKIQLLILDVIMPKKNGKEVYNEIKKVKPDIKAIFTSGYTADYIHKKGIMEERLNFILKPISPDKLLIKVREVLNSNLTKTKYRIP